MEPVSLGQLKSPEKKKREVAGINFFNMPWSCSTPFELLGWVLVSINALSLSLVFLLLVVLLPLKEFECC